VTDTLASLKRNSRKQALISAYEAYVRQEPGSMDRVLKLVNEFALLKLIHLEHEPDFKQFGSAETADDWAQEVSIKVWQELVKKDRKRTGEQFYAWVHKIAFNKGNAAFKKLVAEKSTKVSLFVSVDEEDESGNEQTFTNENPLIHAGNGASEIGCPIPQSVQGLDRTICNLMLTEVQDRRENGDYFMRPRNYAEIGFVLGMTESAVQMRMQRVRNEALGGMSADKHKEHKKAERERKRLEAELESKNSVSIGLAKLRGTKP